MKVYYPGPDPETFHPKLGKLVKDKPFEMTAKDAATYIKAGLLKRAETGKKK